MSRCRARDERIDIVVDERLSPEERVLLILQGGLDNHTSWANYFAKNPDDEQQHVVGGEEFHRDAIQVYEFLIREFQRTRAEVSA